MFAKLVRPLCLLLTVAVHAVPAMQPQVSFNREVRPILADKCFRCHGPDHATREADLRLDTSEGATEKRDGQAAITPGSREQSLVWERITATDPDVRMPPAEAHQQLSDEEIRVLGDWIQQGAKYEGHWAFLRPEKPIVPARFAGNSKNPIDAFIRRRVARANLEPAARASKEVLLRRVTLDLTGLPPTLAEMDAFLRDDSPDAWERVVDRLLESKHFGERMAVDWLDAARYGDTSVFHADGPRDMWAWRDWVIEAYNQNLPYDDFVVRQLAGDLLPNATWRERLATGFNRNNASTDEGGAIAEEYRVEYAVDRVKTTSMVFLGLSMECAQCHDHKYDPISQKDYYSFFAYFNQSADPGMQTRRGNQTPLVEVPDENLIAEVPRVEQELSKARDSLAATEERAEPAFQKWLVQAAAAQTQTVAEPAGLVSHLPLDESTGSEVFDAVAGAAVGRLQGKPAWGKGHIDGAVRTSSTTWVDAAQVGDFERSQAFSYGCWFRADGAVVGAPIARMDDANAHRGYDIHLSGSAVEMHLIHHWPDDAFKVSAPAKLTPKTWYHAFVTYDGSGKPAGVRIYLNGERLKHTVPVDGLKSNSVRTDKPFSIGRRTSGSPFTGQVDDVRVYNRQLTDTEVATLAGTDSIAPLLRIAAGDRTSEQTEMLRQHYLRTHDAAFAAAGKTVGELESRLAQLKKPRSTAMIMSDVPKMRMTWVLKRGQYDAPDKAQPVEPATPGFLPSPSPDLPKNRLGLAKWLVDRRNPLTARVEVNRIWRTFFGTGIVKTVEDFGAQGEWPSHQEHDWDVKRLVRMIVTSQTYQQSSRTTPQQLAADPENRLLSRGPRFRLQAEFIRDQALAVSGLLVPTIGGPGVKPYQPEGLWNEVSLNKGLRFKQDHGENLYRRSMYIYWKRSAPHPGMTIFDAPTREKCTVRRLVTNTPLQALVLMNDPQYLEASRFLAERIMKQGGATEADRLRFAYRTVTGREPSARTQEILQSLLAKELAAFSADRERAARLLKIGEKPRDESLDITRHAAWTTLSSVLLNLDATVTRG